MRKINFMTATGLRVSISIVICCWVVSISLFITSDMDLKIIFKKEIKKDFKD